MDQLSNEQLEIIKNIENFNIIVEAVAGSGKTTTALHIAQKYPNKKVLLITYNKDLKEDTRRKVEELGIKNIKVENYHSLVIGFYNKFSPKTDKELQEVLDDDLKINKYFIPDILILDEVQDMNKLYFKLIKKLINDLNNLDITYCIFGDSKQTLYEYKGSDYRFLTMANKLFASKKKWKRLKLSKSFRVPKEVTKFINNVYYQKKFIHSEKITNKKIDYIVYDIWKNKDFVNILLNEIKKYGVENTFILSNTVKTSKSTNPLTIIINILNDNLALFIKDKDKDASRKVKINKLEVTTINSTKGREKDLVIIYGFDNFYYKAFANDANPLVPNDLFYVAITRAKQKVILLQNAKNFTFEFLNLKKLFSTCNIIGNKKFILKPLETEKNKEKTFLFDVTEILDHLPFEYIDDFIKCIKIQNYKYNNEKNIDFSSIDFSLNLNFKEKTIVEDVSWINGHLVTIIYQNYLGILDLNIKEQIEQIIDAIKTTNVNFYWNDKKDYVIKLLNKKNLNIKHLTELVVILETLNSLRNNKYIQLKNSGYNWLSNQFQKNIIKLLNEINSNKKMIFEKFITINSLKNEFLQKIKLNTNADEIYIKGIYDAYDKKEKILWEFKLTNDLTYEMAFQTVLYAFLLKETNFEVKKIKLFNLYTMRIWEINVDFEKFKKTLSEILIFKMSKKINFKTNDEFLQDIVE